MRGFRGNRAVQNMMSARLGKNDHPQFQKGAEQSYYSQPQQQKPRELPEWLKTAETKALEQGLTQKPVAQKSVTAVKPVALKPVVVPTPAAAYKPAAQARPKPTLTVVPRVAPKVAEPAKPAAVKTAKVAKAAKTAAKKAAPKKTRVTKTKPAAPKKAAPRRKAA